LSGSLQQPNDSRTYLVPSGGLTDVLAAFHLADTSGFLSKVAKQAERKTIRLLIVLYTASSGESEQSFHREE
jgi:hypothetical protein